MKTDIDNDGNHIQLFGNLRGSIPLDAGTTITIIDQADAAWAFEIKTKKQHAKLNALSEQDRFEWIDAISKCVAKIQSPNTLFSPIHNNTSTLSFGNRATISQANNMLRG